MPLVSPIGAEFIPVANIPRLFIKEYTNRNSSLGAIIVDLRDRFKNIGY